MKTKLTLASIVVLRNTGNTILAILQAMLIVGLLTASVGAQEAKPTSIRYADPLSIADAPDRVPESEQPKRESGDESRRLQHDLVRTGGAGGQGAELDPDGTGQGLLRDPSAVWSARVLVRPDLEVGRDRAGFYQSNNDEMK